MSPKLFSLFGEQPEEALYAIFLWEQEAYSRFMDLDEVLAPPYFSSLTKTLVAYAATLGIEVPRVWEFWKDSTFGVDSPVESERRETGAVVIGDLYEAVEFDLVRYLARLIRPLPRPLPPTTEVPSELPVATTTPPAPVEECGRSVGPPSRT